MHAEVVLTRNLEHAVHCWISVVFIRPGETTDCSVEAEAESVAFWSRPNILLGARDSVGMLLLKHWWICTTGQKQL